MGLNKHVNSTSLFNLLNQSKFNHTAKQTQEPLNNENTLKLQQGYIYQCLDLVKPYAKLSHHKKWFEKAILGNHAQISALELWAYLGLHEFVQPEHREKHNNFFMHSLSGHKFELSLLEQMSSIVIPIEQTQLLKNIFAHSDIKNLCDSAYTNRQNKKATHTWMLNVTEYLFNPDNKISSSDFSTSEKLAAITSIISSKLLDSSYYEKFINVYPDFFENLKSQTTGPEFEQLYKSSIYKLQFSHIATNTRTVQFLFNNVQKLEDVDFMANTIKSTALSTRQKDDIFNLYDISDIKFLKNVATKLHTTTSDSNIKEVMGGFLGMQQNATNKELITHIISLDSKYMPICKSAYLQIRISENVKDKPDSHHEKNSRHKL